jgi:GlpG protein
MRPIGHLPTQANARTFGDYLYVQGIENQVDHDPADGWAIWVADEDKLQRATELLNAFKQNPSDPKYQAQAKGAAELRTAEAKEEAVYRKKVRSSGQLFQPLTAHGVGPLTFGLIVASVVVAILSRLGENPNPIQGLFLTNISSDGVYLHLHVGLQDILHGQVWRLVTPIFIHFGIAHLLFNMWCLWDFGSMVEARHGSWYLALMVVVIAVASNLAQYFVPHGSLVFGGMSGVLYGLFGYIWIRGRLDPASGLYLHQSTVVMMLVWFFACLFHLIPNVANAIHAVGLIVGMAWGYLASLRYR